MTEFINAKKLQNNFFANAKRRREAKVKGNSNFKNDAGYWDGGHCEWGGSHNLQEDCEELAKFFNEFANITEDINKIKLSANEDIFKANQQALINKVKSLINKCQVSDYYSIASICCIWNDFFGSFLKKFLDRFIKKLDRHLKELEKLEPKHQKELLDLEAQARAAESSYKENLQKANDPNLSESEKAEFIVLANKAAKEAEKIKQKIKTNPLMEASNFNYLDDLKKLAKGNVPINVSSDKKTPNGGTNSANNSNKNFLSKYRKEIFVAVVGLGLMFYLYSQDDNILVKE